ncbi:DUF3304 domain-containing protein [Cupriavidus sp. 2KB_3]|uniref:DUF3304 domain-containing protein n=1 Tax=Cupriavidus TaxID=106589 RepID=UPI0011EC54F4|nr:DUF3304 domain-containing protein [Cupriavidus campinensis]
MRWIACGLLVMTMAMLGGCAVDRANRDVRVSAWSANYTEDYIYDFEIRRSSGTDTGVGGIQVLEFSRGGTGGCECCAQMPGVGQAIKVVWRVGGRQDEKSAWKTYSRDVVVKGAMPTRKDAYNILMVRFFPGHEVEAEVIPDRGVRDGGASPRVDKLFSGQRVMRHKGE